MDLEFDVADAGAVAERREAVLEAVREHAGRIARELAGAFPAFVEAFNEHVAGVTAEATGATYDEP